MEDQLLEGRSTVDEEKQSLFSSQHVRAFQIVSSQRLCRMKKDLTINTMEWKVMRRYGLVVTRIFKDAPYVMVMTDGTRIGLQELMAFGVQILTPSGQIFCCWRPTQVPGG